MDEKEESELREKLERLKKEEGHGHARREAAPGRKAFLDNRYTIIAIVFAILVINVILRLGLAQYPGFFEPDGFWHFAVITQAIANHYIIPINQSLSGFPLHNYIGEPEGFYYITIAPYAILQFAGISYYTIMRYVPVLFGIFDAFGVYFLAKYLTKSRVAGLLAMLFISISSGDIARTAALVYRGDAFVTIFVIVALVFLVKCAMETRPRRTYLYAILSAVALDAAASVWSGAIYGVVVYILAVVMLVAYSFVKADRRLARASIVLSLAAGLAYLIEWGLFGLNIMRYEPSLAIVHFLIFYVPLLLGSLLAVLLLDRKEGAASAIAGSWARRMAFILLLMLVIAILLVAAFPSFVTSLAGTAMGAGSLGTTIQELQKPTLLFIWDSFSWQIILAPIGAVLFLVIGRRIIPKDSMGTATVAFLAVLAYLIITSYLQYSAIRYNSLVSAPIAIFAAFTIYSIPKLLYRRRRIHTYAAFFFIGLFIAFIALNVAQTYVNSFTSGQADGISAQFLAAMAWMRNSTPANATVLALWPDGSVVEGWANRTSYTDSVGGQIQPRIYNFSRWLFSETPDPEYLYNASMPQYFVVRGYWIEELGGIATEGNVSNETAYGYDQMTSLKIQQAANVSIYLFNTSVYPYYSVELEEQGGVNGTTSLAALLGTVESPNRAPLKSVIFINESGGAYSEAVSTLNDTLNYTFVVNFNGPQITGGALVGPGMPGSNFFRFVELCSLAYCPYNASGVTMQVVYQNSDTKIIKIDYPG